MKRISILMALSALVLWMASCSMTTDVVSSWKSPNAPSTALNKVLVLGMMADRETKDQIEQIMVRDFNAQGISAYTGTSEFGPRGFGNLTQEQVAQKLSSEGYTSLLIVCLTAKDKDVNYVPGTPYISPYGTYYGYWGRYHWMNDITYNPGYYSQSTTYVLDADLYSLPSDQLIYSAQTKSYDPANSRDLADSFSKEILEALRQNGILSTQRAVPLR